jgi:hypothetical protein
MGSSWLRNPERWITAIYLFAVPDDGESKGKFETSSGITCFSRIVEYLPNVNDP